MSAAGSTLHTPGWWRRSTALVLAHPWRILAIHLVLLTAALAAAAGLLRIDTDTSAMLSAKLDWRQQHIQLEQAFPDFRNGTVVLLEAATSQRAQEAARVLHAALAAHPRVTRAFTAEAHPDLRRQGLMLMPAEQFDRTANVLIRTQPVLGRLQQAPHLAGFAELLQQTVDQDSPDAEQVFDALTDSLQQTPAKAVDWRSLLGTGDDAPQALILLDHRPATGSAVLADLRKVIEQTQARHPTAFTARLTGPLPLRVEELTAAADGAAIAAVLTLMAVVILLWLGLHSLRLVLASLLTVLCGLGLTAGFAAVAVVHLNLISVAFTALFIGLAVDYVVHLCMQVRANLRAGLTRDPAIAEATERVGQSLTLCTATTATAFFAFLLTSYRGIAELGLIAGVGVILGLLVSLSLLPALLRLLLPDDAADQTERTAHLAAPRTGTSATAIRLGAIAAALLGGWLALDLQFAYNPIDLKPPQAESVVAHNQLLQSGEAPLRAEVLAASTGDAQTLQAALTALDTVGRVDSAQRLLADDPEQRLLQIDDLALTLGGVLDTPLQLQPPPASTARTLDELRDSTASQHPAFSQALARWLAGNDGPQTMQRLQVAWLGDLPGVLALLNDGLAAEDMSLDDWPAELLRQWRSAGGQQRLVIHPAQPLDSNARLAEFVDTVLAVAPHATGAPVVYRKAGQAVQQAFVEAFTAALVCIALLMLVVLRRPADVFRVLVPLLLGSVLLLACAAQIPIPLNFANIIALPLLLGIAVDNGIHVLLRLRDPAAPPLMQTATGKAVVLSALTTLTSFAALGLSAHRGMASMGQLLALGLVICVLCTLVVLPALRGQR